MNKTVIALATIQRNNLVLPGFVCLTGFGGEGFFASNFIKINIKQGILLLDYYEFSDSNLEKNASIMKSTYFSLYSKFDMPLLDSYRLHDASNNTIVLSLGCSITEPSQVNSILSQIECMRKKFF